MSETKINSLIYCNRCKSKTNHFKHAEYIRKRDQSPDFSITKYFLWICAGCESGTLEIASGDSSVNNEDEKESLFFPKREITTLIAKPFVKVPEKLNGFYKEIIDACNNNLDVLCSVGLRALLEGVCNDKGIKGKNLQEKIAALNQILPSNIASKLDSFRLIGNQAIHELSPISKWFLEAGIEVMEDLLNSLYELEYKASRLDDYRALLAFDSPIEALDLSSSPYNSLKLAGIKSVADVLFLMVKGEDNIGASITSLFTSLDELGKVMKQKGYL